jgi:hypothetical protein
MGIPYTAANALLDNVFKGVMWDTPNTAFGFTTWAVSSTTVNADGTGGTWVSPGNVTNANGGDFGTVANGSVPLHTGFNLVTTGTSTLGTIRVIGFFQNGTLNAANLRFYLTLPVPRTHTVGDSLFIGTDKLTLSFV